MKTIIQQLKIIVLALIIGLGAAYVMAWTGPTAEPPQGNVAAPINEGPDDQTKEGGLALGGNLTVGGYSVMQGLFETYGDTYLATLGGNVGIGTTNPQGLLDVRTQQASVFEYQWDEDNIEGYLTPRCVCDDNNLTQDCGKSSWQTTDPIGSVCYDQYDDRWRDPRRSEPESSKYIVFDLTPSGEIFSIKPDEVVINTYIKSLNVKGTGNIGSSLKVGGTLSAGGFGRSDCQLIDSSDNGGDLWCPSGYYMAGAQNTPNRNDALDKIWCCSPSW